jgi:hypothetical protein
MGNLSTASESVHPAELLRKVEADGFAVVSSCLSEDSEHKEKGRGGWRLMAAQVVTDRQQHHHAKTDPCQALSQGAMTCSAVRALPCR